MAGTSVTGQGPGAADGFNRGSEHMTLGVDHLIGPRVVAAGTTDLDDIGFALIPVSSLIDGGDASTFIVFANDITDGSPAVGVLFIADIVYIVITGVPLNTVNWQMVKTGL